MISVPEDELMSILRCAIAFDSAMDTVPPGILSQLSTESQRKIKELIEHEFG